MVGLIAFPAVLFRAIATIDTSLISGPTSLLPLVFAALIAKVVIFVLSFAFGVLTARRAAPGAAMARGALLAIFATQSDDIGLGTCSRRSSRRRRRSSSCSRRCRASC